jgi:hypothetical protein
LAHRDATGDLGEVFADTDPDDIVLGVAELAAGDHALRIGNKLTHGFDIGREPRKTVGGALLAVEQPVHDVTFDDDPLAQLGGRVLQQGFDRRHRRAGLFDEVAPNGTGSSRHGHSHQN